MEIIKLWYAAKVWRTGKQYTITAFHSFENLDSNSSDEEGSDAPDLSQQLQMPVDAGDQLSFTYTCSMDDKEYRVHGLQLSVEHSRWQVNEDSIRTLQRKSRDSEGYWGPENEFNVNPDDTNYSPGGNVGTAKPRARRASQRAAASHKQGGHGGDDPLKALLATRCAELSLKRKRYEEERAAAIASIDQRWNNEEAEF